MSPLFAARALLFAGECFAASALLLAVAWTASLFLRQAATRHLMWLTAFGVSLMLPLAALIVPPQIAIQHRETASAPRPAAVVPGVVPATAGMPVRTLPAAAPRFIPAAPAPRWTWPQISTQTITRALFAGWLLGVFRAMARLAAGALGLETLKRRSRPHALASEDLPRLDAGPRACELRLSEGEDGPLTWGIVRPVVLLPRAATAWPRERLQAVLLHELAHVRRRDSLSQLLALVACALYWPNPLIWLGARALRREAEIAADDTVLMLGMRPSDYAGALLRVASEAHGHAVSMAGVAMASSSSLEARVESVLKPNQSRKGVTAMDVWKTASLGLALTAVLAVARPGLVEAASDPAPAATPSDAVPPDAVDAVTPEAPAEPAAPARHASHPHHVHQHAVRIDEDDSKPGQRIVRMTVDAHLTPQEQADIDREVSNAQERARQAEVAIARIEPEIERAIASAKISETVARALEKAHVSEKVAQALERARTQIERDREHMDRDMQRNHARAERDRADADHENAGHENAGHENAGHENPGNDDEDSDDDSPE
jgi:beta-lactamase regulating signal transducer with metallopeptidase domain